MLSDQIKLLMAAYMQESTRPDGRKSTLSEYMRYILDGGIDIITSKDCVVIDEENQLIHGVFINDDMRSQASFPIKVMSADFGIIQEVEALFSQANFETFLESGFFKSLSEEKKKFLIDYTRSISNKLQAQQSLEAEPYFNTNHTVIPMPHKKLERTEYVPSKVSAKDANGKPVFFASMKQAMAAVNDGKVDYLKITDDVEIGADEGIVIDSGKPITMNLNGKKISSTDANILFNVSSGSLTLEGEGTIETSGEAIRVYTKGSNVADVTIGKGIKVISNDSYAVYVRGKGSTLTTSADISSNSKDFAVITGNGSDTGESTINILGGTIYSPYQAALYHPHNGTLNIKNATIIGTTGIYIKAGTLNIDSNARIQGIGKKADYKFNNNGCNETGDAIAVDFCKYPSGYPKVNIRGGIFTSTNAKAIECYTKEGKTNPEQAATNVNIYGGMFNTELREEWAADTYTVANINGNWSVKPLPTYKVLANNISKMTADSVVSIDRDIVCEQPINWEASPGHTYDFLMTNGGKLTGPGSITGSGSTFNLIVNNENNYPVDGDGAYDTIIEDVHINAVGEVGLYVQSIDADTILNRVTVDKETDGNGIYVEHGNATTYINSCKAVVNTSDRTTDDRYWLQAALAAATNANVVVDGGIFSGRYAAYIYSSGATITINSGKFYGELRADAGSFIIKGGTFDHEPKAEWIAEGYIVVYDISSACYDVIKHNE